MPATSNDGMNEWMNDRVGEADEVNAEKRPHSHHHTTHRSTSPPLAQNFYRLFAWLLPLLLHTHTQAFVISCWPTVEWGAKWVGWGRGVEMLKWARKRTVAGYTGGQTNATLAAAAGHLFSRKTINFLPSFTTPLSPHTHTHTHTQHTKQGGEEKVDSTECEIGICCLRVGEAWGGDGVGLEAVAAMFLLLCVLSRFLATGWYDRLLP